MRKFAIFDLDGTLYNFDNSSNFRSSKFYQEIKNNSYRFLSQRLNLSRDKAEKIYDEIKKEFNGEVSLGMESKFKIDRYTWFENTWNLEPSRLITKCNRGKLLESLNLEIAILTSAPRIWASKVLDYLEMNRYQGRLFTGEPDIRKPNPLAFKSICEILGFEPCESISIGDQIESDIIPAKSLGMATILIGNISELADYSIKKLDDLPGMIRRIR